jgi:pimeloyl-ACP methyl ester carboxylesterase
MVSLPFFLAEIADILSFTVARRWPRKSFLSAEYEQRLSDYLGCWGEANVEEYYAVPEGESLLALQILNRAHTKSHVRFVSPIKTRDPENNRATFDLFPCLAGWSAPTMLVLHGLFSIRAKGYHRWGQQLNKCGWNAVFIHLPYHFSRRPAGSWAGELAVSPDLVRTMEGVRQAVIELRILCQWIEGQGCGRVGVWGKSYGGWIGAILAMMEERIQRAILVKPFLSLESIIQNFATDNARHRVSPSSITIEESSLPLARFGAVLEMKRAGGATEGLLLAGEFDRMALPTDIFKLQQSFTGYQYHSFPEGHLGSGLMRESFRLMQERWPEDFRAAS